MATKAEERKALEQIRKIVAGLGEDSYIATAFEGCFEDAEENIENDWGCSMKQRFVHAEKERKMNADEILSLREERDEAVKRAEEAEKKAELFEKHYDQARENADSWHDAATKNWEGFTEQGERADKLEQEIIKLKAKLYDLMTKEQ